MSKKKTKSVTKTYGTSALPILTEDSEATEFNSAIGNTKIKLMASVPDIFVMPEALTKIGLYISSVDTEISFLGFVEKMTNDVDLLITDVFLLDQIVTGCTTDILPEFLGEIYTKLLKQKGGKEKANSLCFWGHSHGTMGVSPSIQDDKQIEDFEDNGCIYYIRGIFNKSGAVYFSYHDFKAGYMLENLKWYRYNPDTSGIREKVTEEIRKRVIEPTRKNRITTYQGGSYNGDDYNSYHAGQYWDQKQFKWVDKLPLKDDPTREEIIKILILKYCWRQLNASNK